MSLITTAQTEFFKKPLQNQNTFKPKHSPAATGLNLKGKSEYQKEFLSVEKVKKRKIQEKTLEELQNMISNL